MKSIIKGSILLNISSSFFFLNKANKGGILFSENIDKIKIQKCKFLKNLVSPNRKNISKGGIIYSNNKISASKIYFISNIIKKNKAEIGGAIYHYLNFKNRQIFK